MKKSSIKASHKVSKIKSKKPKNLKKQLHKSLTKNFAWLLDWKNNKAKFIAGIICSLLSFGKIQQKDLVRGSENKNKKESNIRALQRFFKNEYINYFLFSKMLFQKMNFQKKVTILIDRTNWDFGKKHINILVAAALWGHQKLHQKFAIPLIWDVFDKKGNSNTQERKHLVQQLINVVGKENIEEILGDREFIGDDWIVFLHENSIPFVLRFKKNMVTTQQFKI